MRVKLFGLWIVLMMLVALPVFGVGPHGGNSTYTSLPSAAAIRPEFMGTPFKTVVSPDWFVLVEDFIYLEKFDELVHRPATGGTIDLLVYQETLGAMQLLPAAAANSGGTVAFENGAGSGAMVKAAAGRTIIFETRLTAADWDAQDMSFGIIDPVGAVVMDGNGVIAAAVLDGVGFYANDADDGVFQALYEGTNSGPIELGAVNALFTDSEWHIFTIRVVGLTHAEYYVDHVLMNNSTFANALDATTAMSPYFANMGDAAAETMTIDYMYLAITR